MDALVRLQTISKIYSIGYSKVHALNSVTLSINQGEFIAVMGASGSGKSTLMNIIGCLDLPTTGQFWLNDIAVTTLSKNQLSDIRSKTIGFVFQQFNLLPRTSALENVRLPLQYTRSKIRIDTRACAKKALDLVGLSERIHHEPTQLSGGQQQRIAIARALVNEPKIILADEPTGNLDSTTSLEIMSLFQELNSRGITIVLVTHEHDIALCAKRLIVMKDGHIRNDTLIDKPTIARDELAIIERSLPNERLP